MCAALAQLVSRASIDLRTSRIYPTQSLVVGPTSDALRPFSDILTRQVLAARRIKLSSDPLSSRKCRTVIGKYKLRHRAEEFRGFPDTVQKNVPAALDLHVVMDKSPKLCKRAFWLLSVCR